MLVNVMFIEGVLNEKVVSNYQLHTTQHGAIEGKTQTLELDFYNLDMILAIAYLSEYTRITKSPRNRRLFLLIAVYVSY